MKNKKRCWQINKIIQKKWKIISTKITVLRAVHKWRHAFWADFWPPLPLVTQKVRPPQIWRHKSSYPLKNKQTSNFKGNMFRINSIVVRVEGENNRMFKNLKCPGHFICILLELSNEVT